MRTARDGRGLCTRCFPGNACSGCALAHGAHAAAAAAGFATLVPQVAAGQTFRLAYDWAPSIGVTLSFYVDGLSLLFALMITGIGALVGLYASAYLAGHRYYGRFFVYLFAFMLAMLGLVLADNLITLFVFWELTSVTSFLLIGLDHDDPRARRNALQALLVTGSGGLALLAGFLLLGQAGGSMELSELIERGEQVRADPLYLAILILVLAGAFTKSAQVPFHFWLPNAMAAPTPVSAYLHSATMVKAGIYLLARLHPTLGSTNVWIWTLTIVGAVTAVLAAVIALRQTDLKLVLAYTTVLALGLLTMFLGLRRPDRHRRRDHLPDRPFALQVRVVPRRRQHRPRQRQSRRRRTGRPCLGHALHRRRRHGRRRSPWPASRRCSASSARS